MAKKYPTSFSMGDMCTESDVTFKHVHCISCQRNGRKAKGDYYCQDCGIVLCTRCARKHTDDVKMNRHSVSLISETYLLSPNQGPFPELTEIGTIKFDVPKCLRGSTFLPNGELAITDFMESKILLYSSDYTKKLIGKLLVAKELKDEKRPRPLSITETGPRSLAFTADNGCVYLVKVCTSMVMRVERVIAVISYDSNHGECLGIAYLEGEGQIYVSCTTDREGSFIKVYDMQGNPVRDIRANLQDLPTFLKIGIDRKKIYSGNSDDVRVYRIHDFELLEEYDTLEAQTRDIVADKWGYLYTLALERRQLKHPGNIYRLNPYTGVTKVTSLSARPTSIAYCPKTDDVAVTFEESRYVYFYKLKLRTFQKQFGNDLKPYRR